MTIGSLFCSKCGTRQAENMDKHMSLSSSSITKLLNKVNILNRFSSGEKLVLGGVCKEKYFPSGHIVFKQGDEPDGFYMVISGNASVLVLDHESKTESEVGKLGEGDYFGETALISSDKRSATVKAVGNLGVLFLSSQSFKSCFGDKATITFANRRAAVSAESVAIEHQPIASAVTTEMSTQTRSMLMEAASTCALFSNLDYNHRLNVIMSMYCVEIPAQSHIIKQGELGSNLYIVEKGLFEISITDPATKVVTKVGSKGPRGLFGELALMYNAPRAATVTAVVDSVVWVVDRFTFRRIANDVGISKLNKHKDFLRSCAVLQPLTEFEREKIAEALEEVCFNPKTIVFQQGTEGDHMYFISKGEVSVTKDGKTVGTLTTGQFFGELALLNESKRAATVTTITPVECLKLHKHVVKLLLGPIDLKKMAEEKYGAGVIAKHTETKPAAATVDHKNDEPDNKLIDIKQSDLKVLATLGTGSFGHVQLVQGPDGMTYALKGVNKKQIVETQQQSHILSEKWALCNLRHPMIIKLYSTFKSINKLYFLLEPVLGGELFTFLRKRKLFSEDWSKFYSGCVLLAFEYMHSKDILYRDLKPENLLMNADGYLKVTDFGFAKKVVNTKTWTLCGTPDYLAPEIVASKGHHKGVDYWTLGVLIYEMVASYPPFYDEDPMRTYEKIVEGTVRYPSHFSQNVKSLIDGLLNGKPTQRLGCTADGAKAIKTHPWYKGLDWDALYNKKLQAPHLPQIKSKTDTSNFVNYGENDEEMIYIDDGSNWDKDF
jgi:cGMP-dependent protein kinase